MEINGFSSADLVQQTHRAQQRFRTNLLRLSTGKKINSAKDNPALIAQLGRLDAEIRSSAQASRNIGDALSLGAVAEVGATGISANLQRIRELSVQAGNDTLSANDREAIQLEINYLREGIDQIASSTNFNETNLLDGSFQGRNFQVGTSSGDQDRVGLSIGSLSSGALGLDNLDVSTAARARASIDSASSALDSTLNARSRLGAFQNRLEARASNLGSSTIQDEATRSRQQDTDFAQTSSELQRALLLSSTSIASLAHYNASEQSVLRLLG